MSEVEDRRAHAVQELTERLGTIGTLLEEILRRADAETAQLASDALEELSALGILVRQTNAGGRVPGGRGAGPRIALGAAAVHAVLESVLRCERANSPTIAAVAVGRRARVTVESSAEPFDPSERDRLLDPLSLRNPAELGGGLAFSACAEIVRRAGGNFTLGGEQRRSYSIELPLVGTVRPPSP